MSLPKPPETRQRRNAVASSAALSESDAALEIPPLPKLPTGHRWKAQAREWWAAVWRSPMSGRFLEADRHGLDRLAVLVNLYWSDPKEQTYTAILRGEQRFGLTPLDRNRLQWSIVPPEPDKPKRDTTIPTEDPRMRLRRVK